MKFRYLILIACLVVGLNACKPPAKPGKRVDTRRGSGKVEFKDLQAAKVDGTGLFSFAEVQGLDLFVIYCAPWTDAGKDVQGILNDVGRAGMWALPVLVDRRPVSGRKLAGDIPKGRLPAIWSDQPLADLAGGLRALPTVVQINAQGKMVKKWEGYVSSGRLLAERVKPQ